METKSKLTIEIQHFEGCPHGPVSKEKWLDVQKFDFKTKQFLENKPSSRKQN